MTQRQAFFFYYVQPTHEPNGPDGGWDDTTDEAATAFWIKGQHLESAFDYTLDGMDETRAGAQEIADAWNVRFGMKGGEGPSEAESAAIKRVIRGGRDPVLVAALEDAFPNEAAEVGEEA